VATHLRRGGKFYSVFFCSSSQNAGVKELLKSVHVRQSYHRKTVLVFFDSRCSTAVASFHFLAEQKVMRAHAMSVDDARSLRLPDERDCTRIVHALAVAN